jgi:hypothetical protein
MTPPARPGYTGIPSTCRSGETGRRAGLKIPRGASLVWVRFPPPAPLDSVAPLPRSWQATHSSLRSCARGPQTGRVEWCPERAQRVEGQPSWQASDSLQAKAPLPRSWQATHSSLRSLARGPQTGRVEWCPERAQRVEGQPSCQASESLNSTCFPARVSFGSASQPSESLQAKAGVHRSNASNQRPAQRGDGGPPPPLSASPSYGWQASDSLQAKAPLPRSSSTHLPLRRTVPCAARPVGQPWGDSRESHEAGQGGPTGRGRSLVRGGSALWQAGQQREAMGHRHGRAGSAPEWQAQAGQAELRLGVRGRRVTALGTSALGVDVEPRAP